MSTALDENDRVKLIDAKDLPAEWKLRAGMVGKISHFHATDDGPQSTCAYVEFRGHKLSCHDTPYYPLHISRLIPA